jgi:hypothetical protein
VGAGPGGLASGSGVRAAGGAWVAAAQERGVVVERESLCGIKKWAKIERCWLGRGLKRSNSNERRKRIELKSVPS